MKRAFLVLLLALFSGIGTPVSAAEPVVISCLPSGCSPLSTQLLKDDSLAPGKEIKNDITVKNLSDDDLEVRLTARFNNPLTILENVIYFYLQDPLRTVWAGKLTDLRSNASINEFWIVSPHNELNLSGLSVMEESAGNNYQGLNTSFSLIFTVSPSSQSPSATPTITPSPTPLPSPTPTQNSSDSDQSESSGNSSQTGGTPQEDGQSPSSSQVPSATNFLTGLTVNQGILLETTGFPDPASLFPALMLEDTTGGEVLGFTGLNGEITKNGYSCSNYLLWLIILIIQTVLNGIFTKGANRLKTAGLLLVLGVNTLAFYFLLYRFCPVYPALISYFISAAGFLIYGLNYLKRKTRSTLPITRPIIRPLGI